MDHQYSAIAPAAPAPARLLEVAARMPAAPAIESADGTLTYAELLALASERAAALRRLGVGRGDLVAVCLPRSADGIAACLAAWLVGAAYLPLDPAWPDERIAHLVADSGCQAVVGEADRALQIAGDVPLAGLADADGFAAVALSNEDLAYVIYTSGSTGAPKAVEVTHGNLAALIAWHVDAFGVAHGTRTSHLAGLGFDAAVWEIWPTLSEGGTLALVDDATRLDPKTLRDWLVAQRIEIAFAPTALVEPLIALDWPVDAALRTLLTGAERLKARPVAGLPFALVNNYGPTESTVVATSGRVSSFGDALPSIGCPIAGTMIHLLDTSGEPVAGGDTGEIWIGGAQVARGYRGDPTLTAERFVEHRAYGRLYRTGDLAAWLPDGELAFRGRVDDQVKVRGHRVEPAEIAAALNHLPGVAASCVVQRDGELVGYVVPAGGAPLTATMLREALAATLPDYMIPARISALSALPLTASGKLDVAALPDPATCALPDAAAREPATVTERRVLEIIRAVIGRDDIGVDDDFFLLGGHSLLGTQVVVRARDAFGVELTLFHLFEGRTPARLAGIVERLVMDALDSLSDEDVRRLAAG